MNRFKEDVVFTLGKSALLKIVEIFQIGLLEGRDMSQMLRDLRLSEGESTKLELVE